MKKKTIVVCSVSLILMLMGYVLFLTLTTFEAQDSAKERRLIARHSLGSGDSQNAVYLDQLKTCSELFTLYEDDGKYFVVWSVKSPLRLGRYVISGVTFQTQEERMGLSEFYKQDQNGSVYILYGERLYDEITLSIQSGSDGKSITDSYTPSGTYTFYTRTDEIDFNVWYEGRANG